MRGEGKYDGVFSLWYGKGPGVDRSGDVLRHVNLAGSSRYGGAIALMATITWPNPPQPRISPSFISSTS